MIGLVKTIARDYEKRQETVVTMGFPEPQDKERMSVGTDNVSDFTFKLDYTSSGRFDCCMARDKRPAD